MDSGSSRRRMSLIMKELAMRIVPITILVLGSTLLFSEPSVGAKPSKVPLCSHRPFFLMEKRPEVAGGLEGLPKLIYVAKKASYYVESKNPVMRLLSEQEVGTGRAAITCATLADRNSRSFSLYAPVLLDLSGRKAVRDSVWQFQVMANANEVGVWNQKVILASKWLEQGAVVKVYQTGWDQYEILLSRETNNQVEYLSIDFEAVTKVK